MSSRRRAPVLEDLESRELLMGFSMNPPETPVPKQPPTPAPVVLQLNGSALGSARLSRSGEFVNAYGVVTPLGFTRVSGTLYTVGRAEAGTLSLDSSTSHLLVFVNGTSGRPLRFEIIASDFTPSGASASRAVDGRGTFSFQNIHGPRGIAVGVKFTG